MATITIATVDYESYLSVAEGDEYFGGRLGSSAWTGASTDDKGRALITATRWLDRKIWQGDKTSALQALQFPRTGLTCNGEDVDSASVPQALLDACAELALLLLNDATAQEKNDSGSNVQRLRAGSAEIEFFRPTLGISVANGGKGIFPDNVMDLVGCFLSGTSGSSAGLVSGNCNVTADKTNDWTLTGGY